MTPPQDKLEELLPRLLSERAQIAETCARAEHQLAYAQQQLRALNQQIAQLLRQAGVLEADEDDQAEAEVAGSRYILVWKMRDGRRSPDGEPDQLSPVKADGQPIAFGNRQTKLAPTDDYKAAIGGDIDCTALIDSATGEVADTNITWGKPRGKAA